MNTFEKRTEFAAAPVSFGAAFAQSPQFEGVFHEGMSLVERVAEYLDGEGRRSSRKLAAPISTAYATESMRLTTRLLEVASWLLVQRALKNGEISAAEAENRRRKVKLRPSGRPSHIKHFEQLPDELQAMIEQSFAISDRILRIDQAMRAPDGGPATGVVTNPVGAQISTIRTAFTVIDGGRS